MGLLSAICNKSPRRINVSKESEVISFLASVWRNCNNGGWLGLNQSMYEALHLAVKAGFKFEKDDFTTISKRFRFGRWGGAGSGQTSFAESFYTAACRPIRSEDSKTITNRSAAIAFELYKERPAFTFFGKRLYEGCKSKWWETIPPEAEVSEHREQIVARGHGAINVEISSFSGDGQCVNLIWYAEPDWSKRPAGKGPDRRFRLTREDLKRVEKALTPDKPKKETVQDEETVE